MEYIFTIEEIKKQNLKIVAVHHKTNKQFIEIELEEIENKGFNYDGITRVSTEFDIPISGVWKFDVYIDDNILGTVTFDVP